MSSTHDYDEVAVMARRRRRPGVANLYADVPEATKCRLQALAEQNHRKLKAELLLAIEEYLARHETSNESKTDQKHG